MIEKDIDKLNKRIKALEKENRDLKQKNIRIEKDFINAKSLLKERELLARSLKFEKEKRLEYFNLFLNYCGEVIVAVDTNLKIVYSTELYKKVLDLDENICKNKYKSVYELYSEYRDEKSAKKLVNLCKEVLKTGKEKSEHFYMTGRDGNKTNREYIIFNVCPARDKYGNINQLVIVAKDVTEIYEMKELAERAAEAKTNFLANTSHEIRTPMNAILGITELLLRENLSDTAKEYVYNIKSAGGNLLSIINDILDISKIESGKLDIIESEYEFASIINDITNIANVRINDKPIKFLVEVDPNIPYKMHGDEVRLRQIIINIINNAIKFTENGYVKLKITSNNLSSNKIELKVIVEDTGIGIKEKDKEKLFQTFTQVDTVRNRKIEGTGLGLAICKSLLDLMGGTIKLESKYGEGSKFEVILPQKIIKYKRFVEVPIKDENQAVIVHEPNKHYENSLKYAFDTLRINAHFENNEEKFLKLILDNNYDHIFLSVNSMNLLQGNSIRSNKHSMVTVMVDRSSDYSMVKNSKIIQKPLYCLSIAAILNKENIINIYNENITKDKNKFIAPNASILIVDDNVINLKVAKGLMSPYQMKIDTATNGYDAINKILKNNYDIVFMDHMMPDMDGIETTKKIRRLNNGQFKNIVVIALTANAIIGAKDMFLANGMNDFLSKPIEMKELNGILNKWVPIELKNKLNEEIKKEEVTEKVEIKIEGIDTKKSIRDNGFTKQTYIDILKTFLIEGNNKLDLISQGISSSLKRYIVEIHGLKSALANIGAYDLSYEAKKLEEAGRENNREYIELNNREFLEEYKKLLLNISKIINLEENDKEQKYENSKNNHLSLEQLDIMLNEVKQSLDDFDSDSATLKMQEILTYNIDEKIYNKLNKILDDIRVFQYDEALSKVDDII